MANFDLVDITGVGVTTRGLGGASVVGSIDTGELAKQLDTLRADLDTKIGESGQGGLGLRSVVVKLTIGAEGRIAFIAKGSAEASIEVTFARIDQAQSTKNERPSA